MIVSIPLNLVVEDSLSEAVLRRILRESRSRFDVGCCYCRGGYGYIKRTTPGFNNAAKGTPFLILADLECECPPRQIAEWLPVPMHANLLFRIAVMEVESWIMADTSGFAAFLGIRESLMPLNVDGVADPKQSLVDVTRRSRKRALREAIVPPRGGTAKVGPDYNRWLIHFVENYWSITEAARNSPSLERTVKALAEFKPSWSVQWAATATPRRRHDRSTEDR